MINNYGRSIIRYLFCCAGGGFIGFAIGLEYSASKNKKK